MPPPVWPCVQTGQYQQAGRYCRLRAAPGQRAELLDGPGHFAPRLRQRVPQLRRVTFTPPAVSGRSVPAGVGCRHHRQGRRTAGSTSPPPGARSPTSIRVLAARRQATGGDPRRAGRPPAVSAADTGSQGSRQEDPDSQVVSDAWLRKAVPNQTLDPRPSDTAPSRAEDTRAPTSAQTVARGRTPGLDVDASRLPTT